MQKLGDALKRIVATGTEDAGARSRRRKPSSPLMNPNRLRIFAVLCSSTCADVASLADALALSRSTLVWHLDVLSSAGYVSSQRLGRSTVYWPAGLLPPAHADALALLGTARGRRIHGLVVHSPGMRISDIIRESGMGQASARKLLAAMTEADLLTTVRDGRQVRYYPGARLENANADAVKYRRRFLKALMERLKDEHLETGMAGDRADATIIEIDIPGQTFRLELPVNPVSRLLMQTSNTKN